MSAPKRRPSEWLADQMINMALHHPSVPAQLGFGAAWKNVNIRHSLKRREPKEWVFAYQIDLYNGETVLAYATVRVNPEYASRPKSQRKKQLSVYPVSCNFFSFYDQRLDNQYTFVCAMQEGYLTLTPEVSAKVC